MRKPRILLAQEKAVIAKTCDALYGYDVVPVDTTIQAHRQILKPGLDLFVIGIHFDDSNALELVKCIRESEHYSKTPIVMIRMLPSTLAKTLRRSVKAVRKFFEIAAYLELEASTDPITDLRQEINKHLNKSSINEEKQRSSEAPLLSEESYGNKAQQASIDL